MPHTQNDAAAASLQNAAQEVDIESKDLDLTMRALHELTDQPGPDLRPPYQHFTVALARLTSAARRTEATGVRMREKNAAYLRSWDKQLAQMDYEHVRDVSQARRAEVSKHCDALNQRYQESQAVVEPLIAYLQDLQRAFGTDLTLDGLSSLKGVISNAEQNAAKLQTALTDLTAELTDSGARMASIVVAEQPPAR